MENIEDYFTELNRDISSAQTKKTIKVLSRRAKRLYKSLIDNAMTEGMKKYVAKQYRNSLHMLKQVSSQIKI